MDKATVVSIHAPVWGATLYHKHLVFQQSFNPRTRVGCDINANPASAPKAVSIHAPVWGATFIGGKNGNKTRCFNPRTRVGCDRKAVQVRLH